MFAFENWSSHVPQKRVDSAAMSRQVDVRDQCIRQLLLADPTGIPMSIEKMNHEEGELDALLAADSDVAHTLVSIVSTEISARGN